MSHPVRLIPVGVALVFSCVACAGGEGVSSAPSSAAPSPGQASRLQDAPEISVSGDPFAALDAARPSA
ncbi:MAG: N-acetylmuramoyl-L-alanine amidase, partial [Candidatus Binatia bacterium]